MRDNQKILAVWYSHGDLLCGIYQNGMLFAKDGEGGLVLPPSEVNRKIIIERYEDRLREKLEREKVFAKPSRGRRTKNRTVRNRIVIE